MTSVQVAGLQTLASVVYNNTGAAGAVSSTQYQGKSLLSLAIHFTGRENIVDIQLAAGRVLTYLYRLEMLPEQEAEHTRWRDTAGPPVRRPASTVPRGAREDDSVNDDVACLPAATTMPPPL